MTRLLDEPAVKAVRAKWPGAEVVDVRAPPPAETETSAESSAGYSLAKLAELARDEASRIMAAQDGLVADGDRSLPHAGQIERARQFEAIGRILDRVRGDPRSINRLRELAGKP